MACRTMTQIASRCSAWRSHHQCCATNQFAERHAIQPESISLAWWALPIPIIAPHPSSLHQHSSSAPVLQHLRQHLFYEIDSPVTLARITPYASLHRHSSASPSIAALPIEPPRLEHLLQYSSHCTLVVRWYLPIADWTLSIYMQFLVPHTYNSP